MRDSDPPPDAGHARAYKLRDDQGRVLAEHGGIWLLELEKFAAEQLGTERNFLRESVGLGANKNKNVRSPPGPR